MPEPPAPAPVEPVPEPEEPAPAAGFSLGRLAWTVSMAIAVFLAVFSLALTIYAIAGGSF